MTDLQQRLIAEADQFNIEGASDISILLTEAADALESQAAEIAALRRWKSTHAPRIEALEGLLPAAQIEAAAGREAVATLASEREANALLTSELERLRAERLTLLGKLAEERKSRESLATLFRVNMIRAYPDKSHDDITAAIDAARAAMQTRAQEGQG